MSYAAITPVTVSQLPALLQDNTTTATMDTQLRAALEHACRITEMYGLSSPNAILAWEAVKELRQVDKFQPDITLQNSFSRYCAEDFSTSEKALPKELLSKLVDQKFSGKLVIQNPFDQLVSWQIFMGNGKIHFASSSVGNAKRINYMLGRLFAQNQATIPEHIENDYDFICDLYRKKVFSFQQTRSILTQFTQEALVQALSLPKTNYYIDANDKLNHLFLNLSLDQAISRVEKKISYWWELRSEINSPFQRPLVQDWRKVQEAITQVVCPIHQDFWTLLHQSLENLSCLYDIASCTQLSILQLAIAFQKLIKSGDIAMLSYQEISFDNRPLVTSVDDNQAQQHIVEYTLEKSGYRINAITDPFKALASLQSQSPELILINADMETIDGFQLTSLCRKSPQLQDIPILLMVERDNLITRLKAKMFGANDMLQKPFLSKELLSKVQANFPVHTQAFSASSNLMRSFS